MLIIRWNVIRWNGRNPIANAQTIHSTRTSPPVLDIETSSDTIRPEPEHRSLSCPLLCFHSALSQALHSSPVGASSRERVNRILSLISVINRTGESLIPSTETFHCHPLNRHSFDGFGIDRQSTADQIESKSDTEWHIHWTEPLRGHNRRHQSQQSQGQCGEGPMVGSARLHIQLHQLCRRAGKCLAISIVSLFTYLLIRFKPKNLPNSVPYVMSWSTICEAVCRTPELLWLFGGVPINRY